MYLAPLKCLQLGDHPEVTLAELTQRLQGVPQAHEITGGGRQRHLHRHLRRATLSEMPHPAPFFQHAEDRIDDRIGLPIGRSSCRTAQPLPHPSMDRLLNPAAQTSTPVELPGQARVGYVD